MGTPLSVLIVEDSDSDAGLMIRHLQQAGFEVAHERVETAGEMSAALDRQAWDVVLSDFRLPGFSAGEALATLQVSGLDIPFIVVSGVIEEEVAIELMRSGAHDYLLKSNLSRLAPAVTRELAEARGRQERRQTEDELRRRMEENERTRAALLGVLEDQREAVAQIRRLNMAYATLSQTNEAIVRLRSPEELYPRICSIGIESGGYLGVSICLADEAGRTLMPVASAGSLDGYIQCVRISTDPAQPEGRGPAAIALREGRPYYCNDFLDDPATAPWHDLAREFGIRASASLPLVRRNFVVGTLNLYAAEPGVFDEQMRALLEEMAKDVSFAMENFDREAIRRQAERALRESEALFRSLVEQNVSAIFMIKDGRFAFGNRRAAEILGYGSREMLGKRILDLVAEDDRPMIARLMQQLMSGEESAVEATFRVIHKNGSLVELGAHATQGKRHDKPFILGVAQEIGERKKAQQEIGRYVARLEHSMQSTLEAVSMMVELRDPYTAGHERRVGELAAAIGAEMGLAEHAVKGLRLTGYVHDIGKISTPAELLSKPSRLTPMEFELIKAHPRSGYDVLKDVDFPWPVAEVILQHHERRDGSGYPQQLKGEQIIIEARIMAVADVVEAMASHRPYRPGLGIDAALEEIAKNKGSLYDPDAADACLRLFREKGYVLPK